MTICAAEIGMPWMCLVAHSWPNHTQVQCYMERYICFNTSSTIYRMQVEEHFLTFTSPTYTNFQPCSAVRTARSMSSTVVRSFHPPASSIAEILQTPAVPGRWDLQQITWCADLRAWTNIWRNNDYTIEAEKWVYYRPSLLLKLGMVVQWHFLESCQ